MDASAAYFKAVRRTARRRSSRSPTHYRERQMAAVVFTVDAHTATGHPALSSEEIADGGGRARRRPDPVRLGRPARRRRGGARGRASLVDEHGVRGLQVPPEPAGVRAQRPQPTTRCTRRSRSSGVPALFHTGQTGHRRRAARAAAASSCATPTPCCSTTSPPTSPAYRSSWRTRRCRGRTRRISIATHKANVLHRPVGLVAEVLPAPARPRRQHACSGTRCCSARTTRVLTPERWMADFDALDIKPEVRPLILKDNAVRVLGL